MILNPPQCAVGFKIYFHSMLVMSSSYTKQFVPSSIFFEFGVNFVSAQFDRLGTINGSSVSKSASLRIADGLSASIWRESHNSAFTLDGGSG